LYSLIIEQNPLALLLFHSFMVSLLERSEKLIPGITPEALKDPVPKMKPLPLIF
jgi:nitrous oxidase accessory protein